MRPLLGGASFLHHSLHSPGPGIFSMDPTRAAVCKLGSLGSRVLWKGPGVVWEAKGSQVVGAGTVFPASTVGYGVRL